jgi:anti-anti-sigma factor
MNCENKKPDGLYACVNGERCCVRVHGRGSFTVSSNLKAFIERAVTDKSTKSVQIDLHECIGMDSTFMGVLAGLSGRLSKKGVSFVLVNVDEKNIHLLQTLGIDKVLKYQTVESTDASCICEVKGNAVDLSTPEEEQLLTAETMLNAHQALADLNAENVDRFKNVINFLEQDVRKLKG